MPDFYDVNIHVLLLFLFMSSSSCLFPKLFKLSLDKHERKHTGEKHSKHRDYRRERMKEKSSLRGHKDRLSKESGRSVQRPEEEKRKDRRESIPSLVGLRGPGRDFYKPERDQLLGQDR